MDGSREARAAHESSERARLAGKGEKHTVRVLSRRMPGKTRGGMGAKGSVANLSAHGRARGREESEDTTRRREVTGGAGGDERAHEARATRRCREKSAAACEGEVGRGQRAEVKDDSWQAATTIRDVRWVALRII